MTKLAASALHPIPSDLQKTLNSDPKAQSAWNSLTPLARNEWICWITSFKKPETRKNHLERAITELKAGKRRPCCWPGCIHRTDKPMSASQKYILSKHKRNT